MKKILYFILISYLSSCWMLVPLLAQQKNKTDSLLKKADNSNSNLEKIDLWLQASGQLSGTKTEKALEYAQKALQLAQQIKAKPQIADANYQLSKLYLNHSTYTVWSIKYAQEAALLYTELNKVDYALAAYDLLDQGYTKVQNYDKAIESVMKALAIYEKQKEQNAIAETYARLGFLNRKKANYVRALECLLKSLEIWENLKNKQKTAYIFDQIALLYEDQNNFTKSLNFYSKSLELHQQLKDRYKIAQISKFIAQNYENLRDYNKALTYNLKALRIFQELDAKVETAAVFNNLGSIYYSQNYLDKAMEYLNLANNLVDEKQNKAIKAAILNNLALCYKKLNLTDKAMQTANRSLALSQSLGSENKKELEKSMVILSELHALNNNYEQAYSLRKKYEALKDSSIREDQNDALLALTARYEAEKKEKQIAELKLTNQLIESEAAKDRLFTFSIAGALLFMMVLFGLLLANFNNKRKLNRQLITKNIEIESRNYSLQSLSTELQKSLGEKETLLREIHHRVKNNLQVISSLLNLQSNSLTDPIALGAVRDGQNRVKSIALIHQNLYQTENLTSIHFQQYIEQLIPFIATTYQAAQKNIKTSIQAGDIYLDIDTAIPVGLIINELVSNAYKYAFADKIEGNIAIELHDKDEAHYELVVKDDGVGFLKPYDLYNAQSMGLRLVNILSKQLEGQVSMSNGIGTQFSIAFAKPSKKVA